MYSHSFGLLPEKRIRDEGKRPRSWAIELRGFPDSVSHDPKIICCIPSALKSLTNHKLLFLVLITVKKHVL